MSGIDSDELSRIPDFGAIDAESDELLLSSFEVHRAYDLTLNGRQFLVLGRKGSGKTAIYKKLTTRGEPTYFTVGHTFADYPWAYHDKQIVASAAEQERYLHSWKYLVLISLAKMVLNYDQSLPYKEDTLDLMLKIESFVSDTYGSRDPDVTEIFHPGKKLRLKGLKLDLKFFNVEVGEVAMDGLPALFQDVNRTLQQMLVECLNPDHRYFICFDQLDVGFDPSSESYRQRLIGLILAARDFNNAARDAGKNAKVVLFLRSDIYAQNLKFEDKNKVTDTFSTAIEWDKLGSNTLKALMERRFSQVFDTSTSWDDVFDETEEMRGRQDKYSHIADRTFLRPRDIIKFCNAVLAEYKVRRKRNEPPVGRFVNQDINSAKPGYSSYLRDELDDELYRHIPDIDKYLEVIKQVGVAVFTREQFEIAFRAWQERLSESIDPIEALSRLFAFSVVGYYRPGGSGYGGSEYVFAYLEPRAEFNRSAERFRIHRGLVEVLNLKQWAQPQGRRQAGAAVPPTEIESNSE